ncbi:MAG: tRNA lysidine(34) synthetase TilS [Paludibacteraceae bacterium]|jgi:tRNA(Ile)-lysidine synthase|nr:tRNA lysidine(34) synthetase TilS [Paludibacteraceae bacterium]
MQQKIAEYIKKFRLIKPNSKLIIALSGGADSVVLTHILHKMGYNCIAAHCNFELRDAESDRDELFVRQLCNVLNIPLEIIHFNTNEYAAKQKVSIEMAARKLRYDWFENIRIKYDADFICVAHHKDDSIETCLLNIIRGTGINGITGIKPINGKIIRPLLCVSRKEIEDYAKQNDLSYVTDSTNLETEYTRNKIRNILLPMLEDINPVFRQTMENNIENWKEAAFLYSHTINNDLSNLCKTDGTYTWICEDELFAFPYSKTLLFEWLKQYGFSNSVIEEIAEHKYTQTGKRFCSDTHELIVDRCRLILSEKKSDDYKTYEISKNDSSCIQPIHLKMSFVFDTSICKDTKVALLDADKLKFPLTIRKWRNGDFFYPLGMESPKKLSDFFVDTKINIAQKQDIYLLVSGNDIVWIIGKRIDNRYKINANTKKVYRLELCDN